MNNMIKEWKEDFRIKNGFNYSENLVNKRYVLVKYQGVEQYIGRFHGIAQETTDENNDGLMYYPVFVVEKEDGSIINEYTQDCIFITDEII